MGVDIQGLSSYSEHSILSALGITLQQPLRDLRVREAFETFGIVVTEPVRLEAAEGGVIMHIKIAEVAVDPEVQFLGVDAVSIDKVREWAGLGNRTRVYIHEADRIASRLKQAYKKQGYLFVEIQWAVGEAQSDSIIRDLIFNVMEGPKVRCLGVDIRGNDQLPETGALFWKGACASWPRSKPGARACSTGLARSSTKIRSKRTCRPCAKSTAIVAGSTPRWRSRT